MNNAQAMIEMLADFAQEAPGALVQLDAKGVIQWANRAGLNLLGRSQEECVGKKAAQFISGQSGGATSAERIARGDTLRNHRATLLMPDGSEKNILIQCNAAFEHGRPGCTRLLLQETGEQRPSEEEMVRITQELEQRVQQRTAQLEAANKEMESFSYSVSHDLRAPLRALRGFTEVLLELHASQLDSRGQDFLRRACAASLQMERLIEDLLKLAQVSRSDLQMEDINLSSLAGDIAADLANSDSSRNVEFVIAPGCSARGDLRLVRVALDNLLRNSWKFSGKTRRRPSSNLAGSETPNRPFLCATMAPDSTWPMPKSSSAFFSACTR